MVEEILIVFNKKKAKQLKVGPNQMGEDGPRYLHIYVQNSMKKSNRERLTEQSSQIQNCFHGVWQSKNK
jgi:hypothetical protein